MREEKGEGVSLMWWWVNSSREYHNLLGLAKKNARQDTTTTFHFILVESRTGRLQKWQWRSYAAFPAANWKQRSPLPLVGLGTGQRYFWHRYRITKVLPGIDSEKIKRCLVQVPSMSKDDRQCAKSATDSFALHETQQLRCQSHSCNSVWGYRLLMFTMFPGLSSCYANFLAKKYRNKVPLGTGTE